jgi:hypothetical protein
MHIDPSGLIEAISNGISRVPSAIIAAVLLGGPTLIWILTRLTYPPITKPGDAVVENLLWICESCRSLNEDRLETCYRCHRLRAAESVPVVVKTGGAAAPGLAIAVGPGATGVGTPVGPGRPGVGVAVGPGEPGVGTAVGPGQPAEPQLAYEWVGAQVAGASRPHPTAGAPQEAVTAGASAEAEPRAVDAETEAVDADERPVNPDEPMIFEPWVKVSGRAAVPTPRTESSAAESAAPSDAKKGPEKKGRQKKAPKTKAAEATQGRGAISKRHSRKPLS